MQPSTSVSICGSCCEQRREVAARDQHARCRRRSSPPRRAARTADTRARSAAPSDRARRSPSRTRSSARSPSVPITPMWPLRRRRERARRAGLDRADHRHRARLAQRGQRGRRGRVARDQHELDAAIEQELLAGQRVASRRCAGSCFRKERARCRRGRRCPHRAALLRSARTTVSPPTPESNTPIG